MNILNFGLLVPVLLGPALAVGQTTTTPTPAGGTSTAVTPARDRDFELIRSNLSGSWKTTAEGSEIHMHIAPVPSETMPDAMYVELCVAEAPHRAYRQSIMQLYRYKGKVRLRTLEFRNQEGNPAMGGVYAAPDLITSLEPETLVATLDMEFAAGNTVAETPYPYPTNRDGAVQMTSRIELGNDRIISADRGYDTSGNVVWGATEKDAYTWTRFKHDARVVRMDKGLVAIDFSMPEGEPSKDGDTMSIHYEGWLHNGTMFDSSRRRGMPLDFVLPPRAIEGWGMGITGITKGTIRRLFIPSALGYGERGNGPIPPNSDLVFEVEVMDVRHPDQPPTPGPGLDDGHDHR